MSRTEGAFNLNYYVTEKGYQLELEKARHLKETEKIIIEILKDDPLNTNALKSQLEDKDISINYATVKNHLDFLIKEGLVDLRWKKD